MKTIKVNITRSDIDKQLSMITAYAGVKGTAQPTPEDFDRIATVDEDGDILDRYWTNSANELAELLKDFIADFTLGNDSLSMTLLLSEAFDCALAKAIVEEAGEFITSSMAKSWFALTFPEKATEWEKECRRLLSEISRNIHHRRKPTRKIMTSSITNL